MLFDPSDAVFKCILVGFIVSLIVSGYTYAADSRRAADDPKKHNFHPFAIVLFPITLLVYPALAILLVILTVLFFAGFLILFALLLILIRKPFLFQWAHKFLTTIGEPLLKVNTHLIRSIFSPGKSNS